MPGGRAIIARPLFLYHTPIYREKKQVWIQAFTKWKKWHCGGIHFKPYFQQHGNKLCKNKKTAPKDTACFP